MKTNRNIRNDDKFGPGCLFKHLLFSQNNDFARLNRPSQLSVERGDHIVPSFEEISGKTKQRNGHEAAPRRWVIIAFNLEHIQSFTANANRN